MPLVKTQPDTDTAERDKPRRMDRTLQLCARLDRALEQLPEWGQAIVVAYLQAKWVRKA